VRYVAVRPVRERILACVDTSQLDRWLRRAATASAVEDVVRD